MEEIMPKHNEKYKSIQVNLSWDKHKDIIEWLINKANEDETSLNSIVIRAIKKEFIRDAKEEV